MKACGRRFARGSRFCSRSIATSRSARLTGQLQEALSCAAAKASGICAGSSSRQRAVSPSQIMRNGQHSAARSVTAARVLRSLQSHSTCWEIEASASLTFTMNGRVHPDEIAGLFGAESLSIRFTPQQKALEFKKGGKVKDAA